MVVRGASRLAAILGVKPLVLGLTVVSIGTSMPELAVGITASMQGSGSLAVGNIAGTNMVNILFILGLSALLQPLPLHLQVLKLDLPMIVIAAAMMAGLALDGTLTPFDGGLLFIAAILYTIALLRISRRESRAVEKEFEDMCGIDPEETCGIDAITRRQREKRARLKYAVMLLAGMGITVIGADWMVTGAIGIARTLNISDALIGLTIVAIGTSSPELATTVVATIRKERDVAVGNLLGSSIYNILVILGLTCMVSPGGLPVSRELMLFDIPLMTGVALVCVPVFLKSKCISRMEGGVGVALYLIYLLWLILFRT
jgi:cation:H+ antiporter